MPLGWQTIADGGRMAARGVWIRATSRFPGAMRQPEPGMAISISRAGIPRRSNAFPRGRSAFGLDGLLANGWEWTATPVRTVRRLPGVSVLRRLFRQFLRWQTFCDEGRLAAHGSQHAAAFFPQLVPTALSIRVCGIPLREQVNRTVYANKRDHGTGRQASSPPTSETDSPSAGQKELPSKYLYDTIGSKLFEVITELPEYGVTRADERLIRGHASEIVRANRGRCGAVRAGQRKRDQDALDSGGALPPPPHVLLPDRDFVRRRWPCAAANWPISIPSASSAWSANTWTGCWKWPRAGAKASGFWCCFSAAPSGTSAIRRTSKFLRNVRMILQTWRRPAAGDGSRKTGSPAPPGL